MTKQARAARRERCKAYLLRAGDRAEQRERSVVG